MKKNDSMGYVAYAVMLAIALLVGFLVLRPQITAYYSSFQLNPVILVLIAIVVGIIITAIFIELGHLIGAKIGHYNVSKSLCLGLGFKKDKNGKKVMTAGNFDGITGETTIVPQDIKKSKPFAYIYMPLLFVLVEMVLCVVLVVLARTKANVGDNSLVWLQVASEAVMTVAGMILVYDIFPAPLDSKNDGYLLTILTNTTNREAYNEMLLAEDKLAHGLPAGDTPVYDNVTDFTASVNDLTLYAYLSKGDMQGALSIIEKTINSKEHVSSRLYKEAVAAKVAIMIDTLPLEEAKQFFVKLPLEDKKYLASLSSAPAIRAYVLANGLIEGSQSETDAALEKAPGVLHKLPKEKRIIEKKLLNASVDKVSALHPDWNLGEYGYGSKKVEAPDETKPEEAKPVEGTKPVETKPVEEVKPVEAKPEEVKTEDTKKDEAEPHPEEKK
jgi:hypothetical protein